MNAVVLERDSRPATRRAARARPRVHPIWGRSAAALAGGAVAMGTLMLNVAWLPFLSLAVVLLVVMLAAFPLWVALAYWCYQARSQAVAWRGLALISLPSIALNIALYAQ